MRVTKRVSLAATTLVLAVGLTGCGNQSLELGPEDLNAPACTDLSPIRVEDLGVERADCNLLGATLIFPDGTEVPMPEKSGSGGLESSDEKALDYSFTYVGDFGIVAGQTSKSCEKTEIWGAAEAKKRLLKAFGDQWPCPR